jgi:alpha-aminoadipic semialdehyde synthase
MLRYDKITYKQVPLGYKFSWSPKAVLTAALNDAQYKLDGQNHSVSGSQLLASHFPSVPLWKGLALEGLANRDSLPYAQKYGMGEVGELKNLFRGTLR